MSDHNTTKKITVWNNKPKKTTWNKIAYYHMNSVSELLELRLDLLEEIKELKMKLLKANLKIERLEKDEKVL